MLIFKTFAAVWACLVLSACGGGGGGGGGVGSSNAAVSGIGRFDGVKPCTAFVLDSGHDASPAYALTSGHCAQKYEDPDSASRVILNQAGKGQVIFFYQAQEQGAQKPIPVKTLVYSSMNQTDLAVLQLDARLGDLKAQGIQGLKLLSKSLPEGTPIQVLGAPQNEFLKQLRCSLGARVDVTEFTWVWSQLSANDCQGILPGMSGSPVMDALTGAVLGVINTTNDGKLQTTGCYIGWPCEILPTGTRPVFNRAYSVPVDNLAACFANGRWAPENALCPLPMQSGPNITLDGIYSPLQVTSPKARWLFKGDLDSVKQFKVVRAGQDTCQNLAGYEDFKADSLPLIKTEEAMYLACLRSAKSLTIVPLQVDNTPSDLRPEVKREPDSPSANAIRVELVYATIISFFSFLFISLIIFRSFFFKFFNFFFK